MWYRYVFGVVYGLTVCALIWPVYAYFSGIKPFIFGLPLSFAWVIGWLVVMFGAQLWLFWMDEHKKRGDMR